MEAQDTNNAPPRSGTQAGSASAMQANPTTSKPNLQSCQFCRKRKIKCDKLEGGCSPCGRAQNECIYPASQRKGRPRKAGTKTNVPAYTPREEQMLKKIWTLERLVSNQNGGGSPMEGQGEIDNLDPKDYQPPQAQPGRLLIGKSYVSDTFWSNQLKDDFVEDSEDDSNDEDDEDTPFSAAPSHSRERYPASFMFGGPEENFSLTALHPPASQIPLYWKLYLENCERVLRLFHTPSISKLVADAQSNLSALSKRDELLMFSIYFATITSSPSDEVLLNFGTEREVLLSRYENAVQRALVNAGFLSTLDLVVLQSFVLHLICIRHTDATAVWSMTGLAIRLAQGMGLDRDGELFKISPLSVELGRRTWHQILMLDLRSSESRGALPTLLSYDTKLPSNINDSDIDSHSTKLPSPRSGRTDLTCSLLRLEACDMARRLRKITCLAAGEKLITDFEQSVKEKYVQYCEGFDPLHNLCANLAKLVTKRMMLVLLRREESLSQAQKERLFLISIDIMDVSNQLRNDSYASRWSWLVRTYMQWHAIAVVLGELSQKPRSAITDRAWKVVEGLGTKWDMPEARQSRSLYQSIKKLLIKAQAHRASQERPTESHIVQSIEPSIIPFKQEPVFPQIPFDQGLLRHPFHAPPPIISVQDQIPQQFYMPQPLPLDFMSQLPPDQPSSWFFDPNGQSLHDQDLAFGAELWSGWDPVRDYSMHGGPV